MNIFFDLEIDGLDITTCSLEEQTALETIWNYVYDRIFVLIDEIENEETANEKPKAIVIYLMGKQRAVQPGGYSKDLNEKILNCFNENDAKLLWEKVNESLLRFMN